MRNELRRSQLRRAFRATLPETALEVAALLVFQNPVDLAILRKAALPKRGWLLPGGAGAVAGCGAALWALLRCKAMRGWAASAIR